MKQTTFSVTQKKKQYPLNHLALAIYRFRQDSLIFQSPRQQLWDFYFLCQIFGSLEFSLHSYLNGNSFITISTPRDITAHPGIRRQFTIKLNILILRFVFMGLHSGQSCVQWLALFCFVCDTGCHYAAYDAPDTMVSKILLPQPPDCCD